MKKYKRRFPFMSLYALEKNKLFKKIEIIKDMHDRLEIKIISYSKIAQKDFWLQTSYPKALFMTNKNIIEKLIICDLELIEKSLIRNEEKIKRNE